MQNFNTLILTPGKRLARSISRAHALDQASIGKRSWVRPAVLPWPAWVAHQLNQQVIAGTESHIPISRCQSHRLWSEIIARDVPLNPERMAHLAMLAWQRIHEWLIQLPDEWDPVEMSADVRGFSEWVQAYQQALDAGGWVDPAHWQRSLPDLIAGGAVDVPQRVELHGFVYDLTPAQAAVIEAFKVASVDVEVVHSTSPEAKPVGVPAQDLRDECDMAARWARAQILDGKQHVAIVAGDLSQRQGEIERSLREALRPDVSRLEDAEELPWHIGAGMPLSRWPLIAGAMTWLRMRPERMRITQLGALLRSPYVRGWAEEADERARFDAELRRLPGEDETLSRVLTLLGREKRGFKLPALVDALNGWKVARASTTGRQLPSEWARLFTEELEAVGHGSGRTLRSAEFQAWRAWYEVLESLATMDAVCKPMTRHEALGLLSNLLGSRNFREENRGAAIEVLTPSEALGDRFDAMWVMGVTDRQWPGPVQPDPFIPRRLQAECPQATATGQVAQAQATLSGLLHCAPAAVISWATSDAEGGARVSTLVEVDGPDAGMSALLNAAPAAAAPIEDAGSDDRAPALPTGRVGGGTRLLENQSQCPFKALAEQRLGAVELPSPQGGLNAQVRGGLLHRALELFWGEVDGSAALAALDEDELAALFDRCASSALGELVQRNELALGNQLRALEHGRLVDRLRAWVSVEKSRRAFRIAALEQRANVDIDGLGLTFRIDRIDDVEGIGRIAIDYKSSADGFGAWAPGRRIKAPQVPAYTLAEPDAVGVAFGNLKLDQLGYIGLSEEDLGIDGVKPVSKIKAGNFRDIDSWRSLLVEWRVAISSLAGEFRQGEARVDPLPDACKRCNLQALCRVKERSLQATNEPAAPF